MTLRLPFAGRVALVLAVGIAGGPATLSADPPSAPPRPQAPPLPEGVVARVYGPNGQLAGEVTRETLARALAKKLEKDLQEGKSAAFTILRGLIEEVLVHLEAKRLGIQVTPQEVTARLGQLDGRLRNQSGGLQTLADLRRSKGMPESVLRHSLSVEILKERIAAHPQHLGALPPDEAKRASQISVVVIELHKKATIVWGVSNPFQPQPANLGPETLALVNGTAVTRDEFGKRLFDYLDEGDLRDILQQECATKVMETEGVMLSEAEMEAELAYRAKLWETQRMLQSQEVWRTIGYDEFLKASLKKSRDEVKAERYFRSYYGLMRRERAKVTDEAVAKEFETKKDTQYGPAILVHEFQVYFDRKNAVFTSDRRDHREALQIASMVRNQVTGAGRPFADVAKEVVRQYVDPKTRMPDPSVREGKRRLFNVPADKILYDEAVKLKDGEVSQMIETLAEVHVMKREGSEPGFKLEQVKEAVREFLAGLNAQDLLEKIARDPTRVQIRLPVRGDTVPTPTR
jgi:hypothetical protein